MSGRRIVFWTPEEEQQLEHPGMSTVVEVRSHIGAEVVLGKEHQINETNEARVRCGG
ncbi:hypothetical protein DACRYDRAFT_23334 [Dacryopinax primogenitus]|uniref:Uncharacterized protein n=1 Tax=Dacryopinax primogenitus (strain DJM 731) TaxID=1858805 RepID=M5FXD7_DACPD|nr:uncharacterized protein DACRYDRAFT_23334 [Dacryopinax primogenitus]EJU00445.1 hypothetical protein DACRYDRAFT_23334 [Dacryopinax primogenitus]